VDFDPSVAVANLTAIDDLDVWILKLDVDGNYVWAKSVGGAYTDRASALVCNDNGGFVYIAGSYAGIADFDPSTSNHRVTSNNFSTDGFVLRLDMDGNFIWVNSIGGSDNDEAFNVAAYNDNTCYATGYFNGTAAFDDSELVTSTSAGAQDIFIEKLGDQPEAIFEGTTSAVTLEIYPNPSNGEVTVNTTKVLNNATLKLTDLSGRVLVQQNNLNGTQFKTNISSQKNGVYILEINQGDYLSRVKVVKN
jgi:hypothetical protein